MLSRVGSPWHKPLSMVGAIFLIVGEETTDRELRLEPVSVLVVDTVWVEVVGDMEGQEMNLTQITHRSGGYATLLNNRETLFEWNGRWWQELQTLSNNVQEHSETDSMVLCQNCHSLLSDLPSTPLFFS